MFLTVDGLSVGYDRSNGNGKPLLLLHGWGCDARTMRRVFLFFADKGRDVVALDFPGFGRSPEPPETFGIYDYARLTERFMQDVGISGADVIAHSFGGRVAIILAARGAVGRTLLTAAAGVKPRRGIGYFARVWGYKLRRRLGLRVENCGSDDYRALSGSMKRVFTKVVNEHLDGELKKVTCPTLLVWGDKDDQTPRWQAKKILAAASDCALVTMKGCGHFAFLERPDEFSAIAEAFLD